MSLFEELKRRNVFKVGIAYVVVAWLVLQVADVLLNNLQAPAWVFQVLLIFLVVGFPFAVLFAWAFELTPAGLRRESTADQKEANCFGYDSGSYSTAKDIIIYKGELEDIGPEVDYTKINPKITCSEEIEKRFFYNTRDRKYYTKDK